MSIPTNLPKRIQEDMKNAMRAHDSETLATIRLLMAAIKQREVDERITLDDSQVLAVLEKMVRQRQDSIEQFKAGNREDLVAKENQEIAILQKYLPEPLSASELETIIKQAIQDTSAKEVKDMGKVMAKIKELAQGRADMGKVGAKVKGLLGKQ